MSFKLVELLLVVGALYLLWRSADRLGKQAAAERDARERATDATRAHGSDGSEEG